MSNIIFDFDGTIADSLPVTLELFYKFTGHKPFSADELSHMRNMTHKELFKYLKVSLLQVPKYLVMGRREFGKSLARVKTFKDMPETLSTLNRRGHKLYVISSNSQQNIKRFLKANNIDKFFESIHGNIGLFGKTTTLRFIIKRDKLRLSECVSVGDEIRDIDAAKKAKVKCVAVAWGFNGKEILAKHKPDFIIDKPSQLLSILNTLVLDTGTI